MSPTHHPRLQNQPPRTTTNRVLSEHRSLRVQLIPCPLRASSLGPPKNSRQENRLLHPPLPRPPPRSKKSQRAVHPKLAQFQAHSTINRTRGQPPKNPTRNHQRVSSLLMGYPSQRQSWRHTRPRRSPCPLALMSSKSTGPWSTLTMARRVTLRVLASRKIRNST